MGKEVVGNVSWVGKVDWELRKFHGDEYSTHRGSSYNSYLIREKKTVLIDTVWKPYAKEFVENLAKEIDLATIDYVVAHHAEVDHSGALPELMSRIPEAPVYCSENGIKSLRGHHHGDWNFKPVKTGDSLDLGNGKKLVFVETKMLHWPDSIASYLTGDNILFSCDAFGEHYATERLFNDLVDQEELWAEALKYYANILTPFSALVTKKIEEILSLNLPIDIIAPSHGVIWRDRPIQIVEKYLAWAGGWKENQLTILYDTMWEGTRAMAENIALGIAGADKDVLVKLFNVARTDRNDIIAEVFRSKAILVGSPTVNRGVTSSMAGILEEIDGLRFKGKKAAAFGSYGWSGEAVENLNGHLKKAGFELAHDGLKALWNPDEASLKECRDFGAALALATK